MQGFGSDAMSGFVNATNTGGVVTRRSLPGALAIGGVEWWLPNFTWEPRRVSGGQWSVGPGTGVLTGDAIEAWVGTVPPEGLRIYLLEEAVPSVATITTEDGPRYVVAGWGDFTAAYETLPLAGSDQDLVDWERGGSVNLTTGEVTSLRTARLVGAVAPVGGGLGPVRLVRGDSFGFVFDYDLPLLPQGDAMTVVKWITASEARVVQVED
jgi:hypothetical protein